MGTWKPSKNQTVLIQTTEGLLHEMDDHWSGWMSRQRRRDFDFTCQKANNLSSEAGLYRVVGQTESLAQYLLEKMEKGMRLGGIKISRKR